MSGKAPAGPNPFVDFVRRWRNDPVGFVRTVLGVEPDEWQRTFLRWVADGERRISVASGHGVGKSTAAAWAMLWFVSTRYPVKVVVTAPTSAQLFDAMFAELKRWINELPPALQELWEVKADRVVLRASPTEAFISARTSRAEQPEALQGIHSDHVLLIADEASGVPEAVFEAASGSMSGEHATTLLLGNPTRGSGFFYDTHHRLRGQWKTLRVSCVDSPRVSQAYVDEMAQRYGEESNAYRVRVLGLFPVSDDDTVIPLDLVVGATNRDVEPSPTAPVLWGVDVARFGDDKSALAKRKANVLLETIRTWKGLDTMQLTGAIKAEFDATDHRDRPVEILVDSIGLGAGVVDRLSELGLPARGINVSESAAMSETYHNLRSELWHKCRAWLAARDSRLPEDRDLEAELVAPRYSFTSSGRIQLESKDQMKRRGLPSPDRADALMLTFASEAAVAVHGGRARSWAQPLRRKIPGIV